MHFSPYITGFGFSEWVSGVTMSLPWLPILFVFMLPVLIPQYVLLALPLGFLFKKAGIPAWKGWIPFYSIWIFFQLGGQKPWLSLTMLLVLIPVERSYLFLAVFVIFSSLAAYRITLGFKSSGFWVVVFVFLQTVWIFVFAFNNATFDPLLAGSLRKEMDFYEPTAFNGYPPEPASNTGGYTNSIFPPTVTEEAKYAPLPLPKPPRNPYLGD